MKLLIKLASAITLSSLIGCWSNELKDDQKSRILAMQEGEMRYIENPIYEIIIPSNPKEDSEPNQLWSDWATAVKDIQIIPLDNTDPRMRQVFCDVKDIQTIPLENGSREDLLCKPNKLLTYGDSIIYIVDNHIAKKVFAYNRKTGKLIRRIGNAGGARNEYIAPHDIFILNDSLMGVFDNFGRKIIYYNNDNGEYEKTVDLNIIATVIAKSPTDTTLWALSTQNEHIEELEAFNLLNINPSGTVYKGISYNSDKFNYFSNNQLSLYRDNVVYRPPFQSSAILISDTTYQTLVTTTIENKPLPKDFISKCNGDMENFIAHYLNKYSYVTNMIFADDYLLMEYIMPPGFNHKLLYSLKEERIIANGLSSVDFGAEIELLLRNIILSSMSNITTDGNTFWAIVASSSLMGVLDQNEELKRYGLNREIIEKTDCFLAKIEMK